MAGPGKVVESHLPKEAKGHPFCCCMEYMRPAGRMNGAIMLTLWRRNSQFIP